MQDILTNEEGKKVQEKVPLPDQNYVPPLMLTSKKAKKKVATHLNFLKQLTEL